MAQGSRGETVCCILCVFLGGEGGSTHADQRTQVGVAFRPPVNFKGCRSDAGSLRLIISTIAVLRRDVGRLQLGNGGVPARAEVAIIEEACVNLDVLDDPFLLRGGMTKIKEGGECGGGGALHPFLSPGMGGRRLVWVCCGRLSHRHALALCGVCAGGGRGYTAAQTQPMPSINDRVSLRVVGHSVFACGRSHHAG